MSESHKDSYTSAQRQMRMSSTAKRNQVEKLAKAYALPEALTDELRLAAKAAERSPSLVQQLYDLMECLPNVPDDQQPKVAQEIAILVKKLSLKAQTHAGETAKEIRQSDGPARLPSA